MTEEEDQPEPMHPAARKFLEVVLQDATIEGISRHLEFVDEYGGETSVICRAPNDVLPAVHLGFPEGWFPPSEEEWDEAVREEEEGRKYNLREKGE